MIPAASEAMKWKLPNSFGASILHAVIFRMLMIKSFITKMILSLRFKKQFNAQIHICYTNKRGNDYGRNE